MHKNLSLSSNQRQVFLLLKESFRIVIQLAMNPDVL